MTASTARPDQPAAGPSTAGGVPPDVGGGVVPDVGGSTGALVVITGPEWHGREIEISRRDQDPRIRTQVAVRERQVAGGVHYTAVFHGLPAGPYVLWRTATEPASTVVVAPATVTELEWWAHPRPAPLLAGPNPSTPAPRRP